ncbi:prepilin-type N-terminal cleavage/methylation domain-containing protein [Calothrix sp. FACHB-1219]|uniref:pilus assembly FimT family protein n=1 Tax=unclassified Calothrix TaxID=2619626 RepID=UPI00168317CE|nr:MULTISPECIES: prepilin-type N-terminal cleavage/methylation domain-containing protein [unclassified Calothrix]MBD2204054.1 prepilin-type N-terminal cleavage/methylation domain-containing protein [Calothrix sp. FACHB-168]MBD2221227.1 prepilin-type N-terminal cleavage/methylation domain-containing protein [Calothrix sp. FACHB-1219]
MNNLPENLSTGSTKKEVANYIFPIKQDAGFTILEVLVVILIVGVLSAIIAPNWLAFLNRQRLNKASDNLVATLQEAQRQAKRNKRNYSVSFRTNNNLPEIAIYSGTTPSNWQSFGKDVGVKQGQVIIGTNLTAVNTTTGGSVSYNINTPVTITYDYMGSLPNANFGPIPTGQTEPPGLKIVVALPRPGSPTTAGNLKRCVILQTLIGGVRTAKNTGCN